MVPTIEEYEEVVSQYNELMSQYNEIVSRLEQYPCQADSLSSDHDMLLGQGSVESWSTPQGDSASAATSTSVLQGLTTATSLPSSLVETRGGTDVLGSLTNASEVQSVAVEEEEHRRWRPIRRTRSQSSPSPHSLLG